MELHAQLKILPGVTCLTGGGGKTTLAHTLAAALPGTVIFCTTTKIFPSETLPVVTGGAASLVAALKAHRAICTGMPCGGGKLGPPTLSMEALQGLADYVLVEADGSKGLPAKAHADHEPVLPPACRHHITLLGGSCFGRPVQEVVHRPEQFCALTGASPDALLTVPLLAALYHREPPGDVLFINQLVDSWQWGQACRLAALLDIPVFGGQARLGLAQRLN